MNTKLTLRLDAETIARAKAYASRRGRSVSSLVEDYFAALGARKETDEAPNEELPPLTAALWGSMAGADLDEDDYRRHLEERHG